MNINMIIGALKSSKTPKHLKEGLMRKFGSQLQAAGYKSMGGLSATVKANPKKIRPENKMAYGSSFHEQAKRHKKKASLKKVSYLDKAMRIATARPISRKLVEGKKSGGIFGYERTDYSGPDLEKKYTRNPKRKKVSSKKWFYVLFNGKKYRIQSRATKMTTVNSLPDSWRDLEVHGPYGSKKIAKDHIEVEKTYWN